MHTLPEQMADILRLRAEGYTYLAIGKRFQRSEAWAHARAQEARRRLRPMLAIYRLDRGA
jgi:DNA-directed RNA polymerase specialized sigma24 family protein